MDRQGGPEQDWELVNIILLRQFAKRSMAALLLLALGLLVLIHQRRAIIGALVGGGWMVANCAAMVWTGANALKHHGAQRGPYVLGLTAAILGSLALGGWLAIAFQPVLPWLTVGVSIPLAVFFFQVRSLQLKLSSDAR